MATVDVIIETPKGSTQKYDYDPKKKLFELNKILPSGMIFPYDFGFVPDTKGDDGDPLDVIVISEFNSFPGCMIKCRLIGVIKAEQSAKAGKSKMIRNDRYLAIPKYSNIFEKINSCEDLPAKTLSELEDFFVYYNKHEGKEFQILEICGKKEAVNMLAKEATIEE
jgi:inorganic pyrophosphatase